MDLVGIEFVSRETFAKVAYSSCFVNVAVMHDMRLIHTDLKPENILFVSAEYVKVPDYKVCLPLLALGHLSSYTGLCMIFPFGLLFLVSFALKLHLICYAGYISITERRKLL